MGLFTARRGIGPDTILQRNKDMLFNEIDGEVVMLSIENSEYYGLDKVGSRIWELLENPIRFDALVNILMKEYEVPEKQCREDTLFFLQKLADKNVITAS